MAQRPPTQCLCTANTAVVLLSACDGFSAGGQVPAPISMQNVCPTPNGRAMHMPHLQHPHRGLFDLRLSTNVK